MSVCSCGQPAKLGYIPAGKPEELYCEHCWTTVFLPRHQRRIGRIKDVPPKKTVKRTKKAKTELFG